MAPNKKVVKVDGQVSNWPHTHTHAHTHTHTRHHKEFFFFTWWNWRPDLQLKFCFCELDDLRDWCEVCAAAAAAAPVSAGQQQQQQQQQQQHHFTSSLLRAEEVVKRIKWRWMSFTRRHHECLFFSYFFARSCTKRHTGPVSAHKNNNDNNNKSNFFFFFFLHARIYTFTHDTSQLCIFYFIYHILIPGTCGLCGF